MTSTRERIKAFNRPYQTAVAINCEFIGDDNDYSCFLAKVVYKLWKAGEYELAFKLQRTDPLLTKILLNEEFVEMMQQTDLFHQNEIARYASKNNPTNL